MPEISAAASTALSTAYTVLALTGTTTDEAAARALADSCYLAAVHLQLDTIVSASSVTWYLAADAAGDVPLTRELTTTIGTGLATATDGAVVEALDMHYRRGSSGVNGTIYAVAKVNAGTANAVARLTWNEVS